MLLCTFVYVYYSVDAVVIVIVVATDVVSNVVVAT